MSFKDEMFKKKMIVEYQTYGGEDQPVCDWNDERFGRFKKQVRFLLQEYCDENLEGEIIKDLNITWEGDDNSEASK